MCAKMLNDFFQLFTILLYYLAFYRNFFSYGVIDDLIKSVRFLIILGKFRDVPGASKKYRHLIDKSLLFNFPNFFYFD